MSKENIINQLETALLAGHKKIEIYNIEYILKPLARDTRTRKELKAKEIAEQLYYIAYEVTE